MLQVVKPHYTLVNTAEVIEINLIPNVILNLTGISPVNVFFVD